jgi:hypothetical protein
MADVRVVTKRSDASQGMGTDTDVLLVGGVRLVGKLQVHRVSTAVNYIVQVADYYVGVTNTAAPRTITLPSAVTAGNGWQVEVKDESGGAAANHITVNTVLGQTIDGVASFIIAANHGSLVLISDGANWFIQYVYAGPGGAFVQSGRAKVLVDTTWAAVAFNTLLSVSLNCEAGSYLLIRSHAHVSMDAANRYGYFRLLLDGSPINAGGGFRDNVPAVAVCLDGREQVLTTAAHTVSFQWRVFNALWTVRCRPVTQPDAESASLVVEEVRR